MMMDLKFFKYTGSVWPNYEQYHWLTIKGNEKSLKAVARNMMSNIRLKVELLGGLVISWTESRKANAMGSQGKNGMIASI